MKYVSLMILLMGFLSPAYAQIDQIKTVESTQQFGDYTVHFSVFNSTFVPPEVATIYQLNRANNRALVNISLTRVTDEGTTLGLPASVSGSARNLMQQQRTLNFQTIDEGDATYYLAELRHTNEEIINFSIQVQPDEDRAPFTVRFSRTLYVEN